MTALSRPAWITLMAASALLLAGCAAPAPDTSGGDDAGAGTESGTSDSAAGGEQCPVIPGYEYFSDSSVTAAPSPGAVFGDGTAITFEAPEEYYATYDLYYVDENGEALQNSSGVFDNDAPEGVYTTTSLVFGEEANDRPGILELTTVYYDGMVLDTPDPSYVDGTSIVVLGRYCLTLKSS